MDTPVLDRILDFQFDPDTKEMLLAMMGRMMFPVRELDKWECTPYMFGMAGTGKSMILNCISLLYRSEAVGYLADRMDGHFGLEGILNAEVVLGLDMPSDITQAIETSVIKKMCSAEPIVVNKKGAKQVTIRKWEPPIMFSSNYTPTWPSKMGDIPRRILVFKCPDIIRQRDTTLMDKLTAELANIACRIFHAYHDLRFRLGEADIAQHITDAMKQWSGDLQSVTSTVFRFLATPDDERVVKTPDNHFHDVQIIKSPGDAILRKDLVKWFKLWSERNGFGTDFKNDEAAFAQHGFVSPEQRVFTCHHCQKRHFCDTRTVRKCCDDSLPTSRTKKFIIEGLKIVVTQLDENDPRVMDGSHYDE